MTAFIILSILQLMWNLCFPSTVWIIFSEGASKTFKTIYLALCDTVTEESRKSSGKSSNIQGKMIQLFSKAWVGSLFPVCAVCRQLQMSKTGKINCEVTHVKSRCVGLFLVIIKDDKKNKQKNNCEVKTMWFESL